MGLKSVTWNGRAMGVACGLAAAFIWGAFPVVTRLGVAHSSLDAWDVTAIRFGVAGLVLWPLLLRRWRQGADWGVGWRAAALMVCGIGAPYMLVVSAGLAHAPVQQFALITPGSMMVCVTLISVAWLGTRLARWQWLGIGLILSGAVLAGWQDLKAAWQSPPWALALFLAGGALWAVYTLVSRSRAASALHATALVSVGSMLLYGPPYLLLRGTQLAQAPMSDVLVQALYQGLLASVAALFFYSQAVRVLGATVGALFVALVPVVSTLLAALWLNERPATTAMAGLTIVTLGMALALWPVRTTATGD